MALKGRAAKWTDNECAKLEEAIGIFGSNNWKSVSEYIGTRNYISWKRQWIYVKLPEKTSTPWTTEEDLKLKEWVKLKGDRWFRSFMKVIPNKSLYEIERHWRELKRRDNNDKCNSQIKHDLSKELNYKNQAKDKNQNSTSNDK